MITNYFKLIGMTAFLTLPSCATIISGNNSDPITVQSFPAKAKVYINDYEEGLSPLVVKVPRQTPAIIRLEKKGYETSYVRLNRTFNSVALSNLVLLTLAPLGFIVDLISGAIYDVEPKSVFVSLRKSDQNKGIEQASRQEDSLDGEHSYPKKNTLAQAGGDQQPADHHLLEANKLSPNEKMAVSSRYLSGPRVGFTLFNKDMLDYVNSQLKSKIYRRSNEEYSRQVSTLITQFGWQLEKRYTFKGFAHELAFVFVPLLGGVDQGFYMLSGTGLIGLRLSSGFEFAFGPTISMIDKAVAFVGGYSFDFGAIEAPVNFSIVPTHRGARFSFLTGIQW